jgi:hypothetical protein
MLFGLHKFYAGNATGPYSYLNHTGTRNREKLILLVAAGLGENSMFV